MTALFFRNAEQPVLERGRELPHLGRFEAKQFTKLGQTTDVAEQIGPGAEPSAGVGLEGHSVVKFGS